MREIRKASGGILYFDGGCGFCVRWVGRVRGVLARRGVAVAAFEDGAAEAEMVLRWADGEEVGGADAVFAFAERVWWARPLVWAGKVEWVRARARRVYRWVAARRSCGGGACAVGAAAEPGVVDALANRPYLGVLVGAALVGVAWLAEESLPAWGRMWIVAGVLFYLFKGIATARARGALGWRRALVFLFLWPGMDAGAFVGERRAVEYRSREVLRAIGFVAAGAGLIWGVAGLAPGAVSAGWAGMTGLICLLHFGLFALLAEFWRRRGFAGRPIMERPWAARSVAEFWGRRWNRAFSEVAGAVLFRPLVRRGGLLAGTMAAFLLSGVAHELVISLPAGGGFGLPTLYFVFQGGAVIAERRFAMPECRWRTLAVVLGPAGLLFHAEFMAVVMVPFMEAIGGR